MANENEVPTREQVDKLKRDWRADPCWDLADTEGFEAYGEELAAYQAEYWRKWGDTREQAAFAAFREKWLPIYAGQIYASQPGHSPGDYLVTKEDACFHADELVRKVWELLKPKDSQ